MCTCTAVYPLSARFDIANSLADEAEKEAGATAADAQTTDGKLLESVLTFNSYPCCCMLKFEIRVNARFHITS